MALMPGTTFRSDPEPRLRVPFMRHDRRPRKIAETAPAGQLI